jgi:hypothetical protein
MEAAVMADYPHIDENNPVSESPDHWAWGSFIGSAVGDGLAERNVAVMGNVILHTGEGQPRVAPDVMVVPGPLRPGLLSYRPGVDGPPPIACVEILSRSNTQADIERRGRRMLAAGAGEVYVVDIELAEVTELIERDGDLVQVDVLGRHLPGLGFMFVREEGGSLALCCPGGQLRRVHDNPWLAVRAEQHRGNAEQQRADAEQQRADAAEREAEALRAELRRLRGD